MLKERIKKFSNKLKNTWNSITDTKMKRICVGIFSFFVVVLLCFGLSKTNFVRNLLKMAGIYTQEEKVVEIATDGWDDSEAGSIHITKTADWTGLDSAHLKYEIDTIAKTSDNNRDIIIVLDTSASMVGSHLTHLKKTLNELAEDFLSNEKNRISLISFNDTATIMSDFTNDYSVFETALDNMSIKGGTNYYAGLASVETLLTNYVKEDNTDVSVIFLTDGRPNVDATKQITQYDILKENYPYLTINAVQYNLGHTIIDEVKEISDYQFADNSYDMDKTKNTFYNLMYMPEYYDELSIVSSLENENFYIESADAIEVSTGEIELIEEDGQQKIKWLPDEQGFRSGDSIEIDVDLKFDASLVEKEGLYATNTNFIVDSYLESRGEKDITTTATPVLRAGYVLKYDANPPEGCNISSFGEEMYFAFENVTLSDEKPICDGYLFKGWEVASEVEHINEDYFVMPTYDVDVKGTWTKLNISKSITGSLYNRSTFYDMIAAQAVPDNVASEYVTSNDGINFSAAASDTNGKGVYKLSSTAEDEYPIYYYRGLVDNNNVLFANKCWKIVRTTDTGGIKLVYYGEPGENGECGLSENTSMNSMYYFKTNPYGENNNSYNVGYMYDEAVPFYNMYFSNNNTNAVNSLNYPYYTNNNILYKQNMVSKTYTFGYYCGYNSSTGTYTLCGTQSYLWESNYNSLIGKYTCFTDSATCSTIYYIVSASYDYVHFVEYKRGDHQAINYNVMSRMPLSKEVEYSDGFYRLVSPSINKPSSSYQGFYTCLTANDACEKVYYIATISGRGDGNSLNSYNDIRMEYIELENGETMNDLLTSILEPTNNNSSPIKEVVDDWYETNMMEYEQYLEDTVWCNDRSVYSNSTNYIRFGALSRLSGTYSPSLQCVNAADSFTVTDIGNGKLKYPTGLLTVDELLFAGYRNNNLGRLITMTPSTYSLPDTAYFYANSYNYGSPNVNVVSSSFTSGYVKPSISLKSGIYYQYGDGTTANPYVIEYGNVFKIQNDNTEVSVPKESYNGKTIILKISDDTKKIDSFKVNGEFIAGDSFVMPSNNVEITDVVITSKFTVTSDDELVILDKTMAEENEKITLSLNLSVPYKVKSFKVNDVQYENVVEFLMPGENVVVSDIQYERAVRVNCTSVNNFSYYQICPTKTNYYYPGDKVEFDVYNRGPYSGGPYNNPSEGYMSDMKMLSFGVTSFYVNGTKEIGNSFVMPDVESITIYNVEVAEGAFTVESDHYPYYVGKNSNYYFYNENNTKFSGATSYTITIQYQLPSTGVISGNVTTIYGPQETMTTKTYTMSLSQLALLLADTESSGVARDYYGFKAVAVPTYPTIKPCSVSATSSGGPSINSMIWYSESVTYSNGAYQMVNPKYFYVGADTTTLVGKYSNFSGGDPRSQTLSQVFYIDSLDSKGAVSKYAVLTNGTCAS